MRDAIPRDEAGAEFRRAKSEGGGFCGVERGSERESPGKERGEDRAADVSISSEDLPTARAHHDIAPMGRQSSTCYRRLEGATTACSYRCNAGTSGGQKEAKRICSVAGSNRRHQTELVRVLGLHHDQLDQPSLTAAVKTTYISQDRSIESRVSDCFASLKPPSGPRFLSRPSVLTLLESGHSTGRERERRLPDEDSGVGEKTMSQTFLVSSVARVIRDVPLSLSLLSSSLSLLSSRCRPRTIHTTRISTPPTHSETPSLFQCAVRSKRSLSSSPSPSSSSWDSSSVPLRPRVSKTPSSSLSRTSSRN